MDAGCTATHSPQATLRAHHGYTGSHAWLWGWYQDRGVPIHGTTLCRPAQWTWLPCAAHGGWCQCPGPWSDHDSGHSSRKWLRKALTCPWGIVSRGQLQSSRAKTWAGVGGACQGPRSPHRNEPRLQRRRDSRARVGCLVALEGVSEVVLAVQVALCAQVVVHADAALPAHAPQPMFLAAITDDIGVPHAWGRGRVRGGGRAPPPARPAHAPIWALS